MSQMDREIGGRMVSQMNGRINECNKQITDRQIQTGRQLMVSILTVRQLIFR